MDQDPELHIWEFSIRPDLGPTSDEYLDGCLRRVREYKKARPLVRLLSELPDGQYPWNLKDGL